MINGSSIDQVSTDNRQSLVQPSEVVLEKVEGFTRICLIGVKSKIDVHNCLSIMSDEIYYLLILF